MVCHFLVSRGFCFFDMKEYDIEKIAGRRMVRRFGFLYYLSGMGFLLRRLRIRERSIENVEQAQERGQIVYVLYARSKMDWLALNRVLQENRLPLAVQLRLHLYAFSQSCERRYRSNGWICHSSFLAIMTLIYSNNHQLQVFDRCYSLRMPSD